MYVNSCCCSVSRGSYYVSTVAKFQIHIWLHWFSFFLAIIQKRLKKEKKAKRKLQEALEFETKRREQAEQTLKQAASTDTLRVLNGRKSIFASLSLTFNLSAKRILLCWKFITWWERKKKKIYFLSFVLSLFFCYFI